MFFKPQSKLLPHANASIVSNGRLIFVNVGTKVQIIKWESKIKLYKRYNIIFFNHLL